MLESRGTGAVKKCAEAAMFAWSELEHVLSDLPTPDEPEDIVYTHVDDVLNAFKKASNAIKEALGRQLQQLHLKQQTRKVCAVVEPSNSEPARKRLTATISAGRARHLERKLTRDEITLFRGVLGQLPWRGQQSRPDLCVGVSLTA